MTELTEMQIQILRDIYEKSNQGVNAVSIGKNGIFIANTPEKAEYAHNLQELQDMGYITGVSNNSNLQGIEHYVLTQVKITPKGIALMANLK